MKKLLSLIAALLPCFLAHSQEADNLGSYAEVKLVSRLDLNPTYSLGEAEMGFDFGNSILCTTFEGAASEHFSWFICNHWLNEDGYKWPWQNLGRSDEINWLDYCYADFSFGNWTFRLGKDFITTGGFECDDWDWDAYYASTSPFYDGLASYQWGGKVIYTLPSENHSFSLQMVSSPYGEHPFSSGLWSYSLGWSGEYDYAAFKCSYSAMQYDKGDFDHIIAIGQQYYYSDWTFTWDCFNNSGYYDTDSEYRLAKGFSYAFRLQYAPSDSFDVQLRYTQMDKDKNDILPRHYKLAAIAQYYPLKDSQDLRLHAAAGYDSLLDCFSLMLGAKYEFSFKLW